MRRRGGFTLIELLIAIGVVAFIIFGVLGTNSSIQVASQTAQERTAVLQDANRILGDMRDLADSGLRIGRRSR